ITCKPFARFWLHSEFLNVEWQKMSKSLGNIYTLRELMGMGHAPETVRYLLISVPYRKKLNFTFDGLQAAKTTIDRLRNFQLRLETDKLPAGMSDGLEERRRKALDDFDTSLDDDLNTAEALAAVFEYVRDANTAMDGGEFRGGNTPGALELLSRFDSIVDVLRPTAKEGGLSDAQIDEKIQARTQAKKSKDFALADQIRAELTEAGVILEDTKDGVRWKRK
ncbi:MAG: cysteine--tRNA ligase, partial [Acidobacteriaceae bacterium]|nr:cysteine--tRNA ligase [Acidobacteriaceae bacterium]